MNKRTLLNWIFANLILSLLITSCVPANNGEVDQVTGIEWAGDSSVKSDLFDRSDTPREFIFPDDHGVHPNFQTEWWYFTGNTDTSDGEKFGYQLTFFRRAILPEPQVITRKSNLAVNQVYMAHFALTDISGGQFYSFERFSRGDGLTAGATNDPYMSVWLKDWFVSQIDNDSFQLTAAVEGLSIDLILKDSDGILLQGDNGLSRKSLETASYYYSLPRILTDGSITVQQQEYEVSGLSWMDHEFSTSTLAAGQIGWDWFSLHLDDGKNIMVYSMRLEDGSIDPYSHGSLSSKNQEDIYLPIGSFDITAIDYWTSPQSGAEYPSGWRVSIPSQGIDLKITPAINEQELNLSFTYWEGSVYIEGTVDGNAVNGSGYVEMTGYAHSMQGRF